MRLAPDWILQLLLGNIYYRQSTCLCLSRLFQLSEFNDDFQDGDGLSLSTEDRQGIELWKKKKREKKEALTAQNDAATRSHYNTTAITRTLQHDRHYEANSANKNHAENSKSVIYPSNKEGYKQQTLYHVSQSCIDIKSNQRGKKCIEATPSHPRN